MNMSHFYGFAAIFMRAKAFISKIGLVVNPGPAAHGSYALILLKRYPKGWKAAAELRSI